jgi:8-oxo-dGTP pyrophosphatase MutT (NUDIX family)
MEDSYHLGIKALIRNKKGEVLLLQVNKKELSGESREYWDIPGGRVQRGDTIEDTLIREIEEETGIKKVRNIKPLSMVVSNIRIPIKPKDVGLILSVYTADINENEKITLSKEHVASKWFEPKEAAKLLEVKFPAEFTTKIANL